jgi:hypothetical protein
MLTTVPSRVLERSNPFGPLIVMSHWSLSKEPITTTRQSPDSIRKHVFDHCSHVTLQLLIACAMHLAPEPPYPESNAKAA